eukprot:TRINITY_DN101064_c0_g1_i1.p1 TRINITY_DN101064_c0_g1~~TRINITY_DN101064_c0_g1_i1.p1  ORF type:complete len:109 (-),score=11.63 TRINITY_DN101064_c0_g1_i1:23-349(-)
MYFMYSLISLSIFEFSNQQLDDIYVPLYKSEQIPLSFHLLADEISTPLWGPLKMHVCPVMLEQIHYSTSVLVGSTYMLPKSRLFCPPLWLTGSLSLSLSLDCSSLCDR